MFEAQENPWQYGMDTDERGLFSLEEEAVRSGGHVEEQSPSMTRRMILVAEKALPSCSLPPLCRYQAALLPPAP